MSQRTQPLPRWLVLAGAIIPILAALVGTAAAMKHSADETYVRRDTFALIHKTDSLIGEARNARIDTALNALVRACQRKRECP